MKKILLSSWIPTQVSDHMASEHELIMPSREKSVFTYAEAMERAADCDGIFTDAGALEVTAEMIDAAPRLKAIATNSVGFDHIDVAHAHAKGIAVVNTPTMVTDPTAELALGLIIDVARRISFFDRRTRALGDTTKKSFGCDLLDFGRTPAMKTLGIVGFGRIGREVARKAHAALGMKIIYSSPSRAPEDVERITLARRVTFDELLKEADFVSVHCPYRPENHHMFGEAEFAKMKPTAFFLNLARGKIHDERALVEALKAGKIAGAALDVYEDEPKVAPELLELDSVVLAPHIGTYTLEDRSRMLVESLDGLVEALAGGTPANIVTLKKRS